MEMLEALRRYLTGEASLAELSTAVTAFDWDDVSPESLALRPVIGRLELLIEEVAEGFCDEAELKLEAIKDVAAATQACSVTWIDAGPWGNFQRACAGSLSATVTADVAAVERAEKVCAVRHVEGAVAVRDQRQPIRPLHLVRQ